MELSHGRVLIYTLDISSLPLKTLRRALAMVPQDPVLFTGTIRFNLDPESSCTDAQIWSVLEHTFLRDIVQSHPDRLEMDVSNCGGLFSVGQKQLLCLARAILRQSPLVIMDEATSSVDRDTDALIQQSLRTCFRGSTIITIAHQLEAILDYDRVIVMAGGQIVEMGEPKALARNTESEFGQMISASGIIIETDPV